MLFGDFTEGVLVVVILPSTHHGVFVCLIIAENKSLEETLGCAIPFREQLDRIVDSLFLFELQAYGHLTEPVLISIVLLLVSHTLSVTIPRHPQEAPAHLSKNFLRAVLLSVNVTVFAAPTIEVGFHVALVGSCNQLLYMLGPIVLTGTVSCFDLDIVFSNHRLDFCVLPLNVFKLHSLHLDDHCATIDSPQVECL